MKFKWKIKNPNEQSYHQKNPWSQHHQTNLTIAAAPNHKIKLSFTSPGKNNQWVPVPKPSAIHLQKMGDSENTK